jgi:putative addiction module component (TIGR02574 family)
MNTEEIITTVNDLPVEERIRIADAIRQSLNPIDPDVQEAWAEEADQRLQQYFDGKTKAIPAEQFEKRIKERHATL